MKTYDPRDVNVIVSGTFLTGFAEGTFVKAEKDEANYSTHVGAQGEVSRARVANPLGTLTVTIKSDSPSNALLNRLANSKDTFIAQVVDSNDGKFKAGGKECFIEKPAAKEYGNEITTREWVIKVTDYDQKES